ncbi:MAG: hypothetical protein HC841_09045, partial [Verrucomicrobiae bacterium]|nr:hypothetical protein [Verrucomicrobiae bacterium]
RLSNVGSDSGAGDPDLDEFNFVKVRFFRQTNATPESLDRHALYLATDLLTVNGVTNGVIEVPNGMQAVPFLETDIYDFEAEYASQAQLDSFFPDGSYEIRFDTINDGTRTFTFSLTGSYPNAPTVTNLAAAQGIDPASGFVLGWNAFAGAGMEDEIFLEITLETGGDGENEIFYSDLPATATSVLIPAYRLAPGRTYRALLVFANVTGTDTTTYPGVDGKAGFYTATVVELRTTGEQIQPRLELTRLGPSDLRLTVIAVRDLDYTVDSRFSLFDMWQPIQFMRVNGPEGSFTGTNSFILPNAFQAQSRFFQAREDSESGHRGGNWQPRRTRMRLGAGPRELLPAGFGLRSPGFLRVSPVRISAFRFNTPG